MDSYRKEIIAASIQNFHLPAYEAIPDVGLYLEQTVRYAAHYLSPLPGLSITASMVGNYVKKGLIANPVKKLYHREQIAYILFIAVAKTVLSLEDIQLMIRVQQRTYEAKTAYEYFCREFENILQVVFGLKDHLDAVGEKNSDERTLLRNTIIAIAHKIYLDEYLAAMRENLS